MSKYDAVSHRVPIEENNPSIVCDDSKCKKCKLCIKTCQNDVGVYGRYNLETNGDRPVCINCGQCIIACPFGAIQEVSIIDQVNNAINDDNKIVIFNTAPAVRVALGDEFGMEPGSFVEKKMVSAIRYLGADYVFDITFGADATIVEEAAELVDRIKNNGVFPMFTSCCPAWVKYCEIFNPEYLDNLSSAKSPIGMQASLVKTYFAEKENIDVKKIVNVIVAPCTAKKAEAMREELNVSGASDVDYVLTTRELAKMIKDKGIDFVNLEDFEFDSVFGRGSSAGMIFGNTGGVMEAALRTAHYYVTGDNPDTNNFIDYESVRGLDNVKEATVKLGDLSVNVAVVHQTSQMPALFEKIKSGEKNYHFIEVMACVGGCANGGGQPKVKRPMLQLSKEARNASIYNDDKVAKIRLCHENPAIKKVYSEYIGKPLGEKAHKLLHTHFADKSDLVK